MRKKKNAFTLIELLAVMAILAIILVISIPKILNVIEISKINTLKNTVKLIADSAEKKYITNKLQNNDEKVTCDNIAQLSKEDYSKCTIRFNSEGKATINLIGKGKFDGLVICNGTKENAELKEGDSCATDAKYFAYEEVEGGISITGYSIEGGTDVIIPEKINGKTVVGISEYAFTTNGVTPTGISSNNVEYKVKPLYNYENKYDVVIITAVLYYGLGITSVEIPDTVTSIGHRAFAKNQLTNSTIVFPTTPLTIDCDAFSSNLEEIIYPSNVTDVCR